MSTVVILDQDAMGHGDAVHGRRTLATFLRKDQIVAGIGRAAKVVRL